MASTNLKRLKNTSNNAQSDECYTPKEAIEPMLQYLNPGLTYYECTSGKSSSIVDYLNAQGFKCVASEGRDFLTSPLPEIDVIITNPPYSKKDKFIERCYALNKPFALLLPVSALQGQKRGEMFSENGIEILALNKRIDFTGKGAPHFGVAWFCRGVLPEKLQFSKTEVR